MNKDGTKTKSKCGENNPRWKGGTSNYYRREARKIMNCPLKLIVHHIDGNYKNNKKENLQIMTQSKHVSLHNKQRTGNKKEKSLKYIFHDEIMKLTKKEKSSREIAKILKIGKTTVLRSRRLISY